MNPEQYPQLIRTLIAQLRERGGSWAVRQIAEEYLPNASDMNDQELDTLLWQADQSREILLDILDALELILVETALMKYELEQYFSQYAVTRILDSEESDMQSPYIQSPTAEVFDINDLRQIPDLQAIQSLQETIAQIRGQIRQ